MKTKIEWCDETWNTIRGCSRISEGCRNCYAEKIAYRFSGKDQPYEGLIAKTGQWNGQIKPVPEKLTEPLRWKKPRKIFVNSMSDLFHENAPDYLIDQVFSIAARCPQHTFMILTKRPESMCDYMNARLTRKSIFNRALKIKTKNPLLGSWPLPNVWLGVSVEDQATANERIPHLLQTPATVRWISAEPLLGEIDLSAFAEIDWVVAGGESGPGARPSHPEWFRFLRDQCQTANVSFFFKQWGEWAETGQEKCADIIVAKDGRTCAFDRKTMEALDSEKRLFSATRMYRVGKKKAGNFLDGKQHLKFPTTN